MRRSRFRPQRSGEKSGPRKLTPKRMKAARRREVDLDRLAEREEEIFNRT